MNNSFSETTMRANERSRLAALRSLNLIDAPPDTDFDHLVLHLVKALAFPIGFISLIDEDRLWFKSSHGMKLTQIPRAESFCDHTIRDDLPMVVENALLDDRFSDLPLVASEPHLRAYAGAPIRTINGHRIGTICVADIQPRQISEEQTTILCRFASLVERMIAAAEYTIKTTEDQRVINELESQRASLADRLERLETGLAVGQWELDLVTHQLNWTDGIFNIHGLDQARGPSLETALSYFPDPDRTRIITNMKLASEAGRPFDITARFIDEKKHSRHVRVRGRRVVPGNGNPRLEGIFQDVTDQHEIQARLIAAMENDPVTRVRNSQSFEKVLADWVADENRPAFGLVTIGVPEIMTVRQSLGMSLTDMMLREIANAMRSQMGDGEILARTSFDAFSFLMEDVADTVALNNRLVEILTLLNRSVAILRKRLDIEPQGAVALYPADGQMPVDLLRAADLAFRAAHDDPEVGIAFFNDCMRNRFEVRESASSFLQHAIDAGRVVAYFQPIIRLSDGQVSSFEALVRVLEEDGSILGPARFWPALMHPHIARKVGFIMRDAIIDQLTHWRDVGLTVPRISLNATTTDLSSGGMYKDLLQVLESRGIQPAMLKVEVTENVLLANPGSGVETNIAALREHGIGISLDDFGTGYASLTNLLSLPTDEVKVDGTFILTIEKDADSRAITGSILDMAAKMHIDTVSEGIETAHQLAFVRDNGSTHGQGFLLGRPMSSADATALARIGRIDIEALLPSGEGRLLER